MSQYTRFPDPAGGIKIYPSVINFPADPGRDGVQAVAADTNTIYIYDTSIPGWAPVANPGAAIAIDGLMADVSATGPGVVNATVNSVGGASAADIATSVLATQAATDSNTPSTIVKRDALGKFKTQTIQLDSLTASQILASDASLNITSLDTATYPSLTELSYVKGVTSAIQTQLNALQPAGNYITALTGEVTATGPGSVAATITNSAVTNAKLADMANNTIKGNIAGAPAAPSDLSGTQVTGILDVMVGDTGAGGTKGLAPAPAIGDASKVLSGAGTWQFAGLGNGAFGAGNIFVGKGKPAGLSGGNNFIIDVGSAGDALTTGFFNILIGRSSVNNITTGSNNVVVGHSVTTTTVGISRAIAIGLNSVVEGGTCVAIGTSAKANTNSVSVGDIAGNSNSIDSVAIGYNALRNAVAGANKNIAIGPSALTNSGLGSSNVAIGYYAGQRAVSSNELYIGNQNYASNALEKSNSLIFGTFNATPASQTLALNAAVTATYGLTTTTVKQNGATSGTLTLQVPATVTSYSATWPSAQGAANTYLKNDGSGNLSWATAGVVTVAGDAQKVLASDGTTTSFYYAGLGAGGFGTSNVFLGKGKPAALTTSTNNIIVSPSTSGDGITTGSYNVIMSDTGLNAGNVSSMVAIGTRLDSFGAFKTVIIGDQAKLSGANSYESVIIGYSANGGNNAFNTIVGASASATGTNATVLGYAATASGFNYSTAVGNAATSGNGGTSHGYAARSLGTYSTAVGAWSGNNSDSGSYNTWIGSYSGYGAAKSGSYNTAIGHQSAYSLTSGANSVFLGYNAGYRSTTQSNELFIDNQDRATYAAQQTGALVYGVFNATPSSQTLTVNAALKARFGVSVTDVGYGLAIKEGSNAKMGTATLAAGTVTVSTTAVTASSRIFITVQSLGTITVPVAVAVTARTAGTSFTITSADNTDTSTIAWMLVEPA